MTYEINKMSSEECNWAEEHWTKKPLSLSLRRKVTDAVDFVRMVVNTANFAEEKSKNT